MQIAVADTGAGMDEATQAQAFEPFFTTKATGKGTGLSLSQVYGFAQQLGGSAGIVSAPSEGTTVMIWLPRAEGPVEILALVPQAEPVALSHHRILVVDDDDVVRALAQEMLTELDHQVTAVGTGQLAAEAIRLRPELPVPFITGYADTEILKPWRTRGYVMLAKPFSSADLGRAIQHIVARLDQGRKAKADVPPTGSQSRMGVDARQPEYRLVCVRRSVCKRSS